MSKRQIKSGKSAKKLESQWINNDVKVSTGLPPQVDGQIRCFCKLTISQIVWTIPKPPDFALIRVKWWGEEGNGIFFRPFDVKKGNKAGCKTTARYPVRSGPMQFATYLTDMDKLTLEMMTSPDSGVIGQAHVTQIGLLSNSRPINGFFPVISPTGQRLANLQVALVLEPLMVSYDDKGAVPTTDTGVDNYINSSQSMIMPEANYPTPHKDVPSRPVNTVFKSPISELKRNLQEQENISSQIGQDKTVFQSNGDTVAITANGDVVHVPNAEKKLPSNSLPYQSNTNNNSMQQESPTKMFSSGGRDLLSVLVDRGTKLREAMIVSSMHADLNAGHVSLPTGAVSSVPNNSNSNSGLAAAAMLSDEQGGNSKSAVDFILGSPIRNQDLQLYKMINGLSPGSSMSSDIGYDMMSEPEDPLHENSILQDLFYYHSDAGDLAVSDISGYEHFPKHKTLDHYMSLPDKLPGGNPVTRRYSVEEPGNYRPPSRTSSVISLSTTDLRDNEVIKKKKGKRKARTRSRSSSRSISRSRSNSLTRKRSNVTAKPALNLVLKSDAKENTSMPKKKSARSRSTSRSRSRSRKKRASVDEVSDSDQQSVTQSEASKVSFDPVASDNKQPKIDGLSVERLTLLGRVHVARVSIDHLQHTKQDNLDTSDSKVPMSKLTANKPPKINKTKKPSTYFVEYQFPVVAVSRDKYDTSAMATEITRVASKNVKNGAIIFNHRSVFPVMFDGAAIERWWKSALVFRIYNKEAGEQTPTLVGSGGISLKSILRSENLSVQREIEIPDTSKNGLLNVSRSSLNSSLNNRNTAHLLGHLKVSVELASDHKEFAVVMAKTRLAEMNKNIKLVPIGGLSPEQVKLVEQLNKNKDQPVIKLPPKQGFQTVNEPSFTTNNSVSGLPPQSPRRRNQDEGDEISRLKQQLKATLAVLGNAEQQQKGSITMSTHTDLVGLEPLTLYTMLYIQEGRKISLVGVPPLHMANKHPTLLKPQPEGRDSVIRNTYLVCRMFWCNDAVHSNVCWGTLDPEYNFLQVAPVMMTSQLLERLRNNYMVIEVWDKKVGAESDKLIGMVKLSLHQFFMSFRERKITNALLKSEYPVMAIDNYMPIVDPFSGLHYGQLKVILAMGSESQIATLQRLAVPSTGAHSVPHKPLAYLERQHLLNGDAVSVSNKTVEHQFEVTIEGIRDLKLFEKMMWGEADCFVQFFFPAEGEAKGDGIVTLKSIPTMKCYRTATTLCTPDPTFHDSSRHKITLPFGAPVQRELLTACANSGGGVTGLPFEVWCRYYHPNVRDQLIAKSLLPLTKLCAMITMHKTGEPCVQSFSLRLSQVSLEGQPESVESVAKSKCVGLLDVTINYKALPAQIDSSAVIDRDHNGSQVCLSVGVIRASGLKAAADYMALIDPSMAYPADVGVNSYVRIKISFLGKENERITKTVARSFSPEFSHYMDFPCPLLMTSSANRDATSLAELLETGEALFELWHQIPTGLNREYQVDRNTGGLRQLIHQTGDILLGTTIVPLMSLLTKRKGVNGWFAINLPSLGWIKPIDEEGHPVTALDQVVGGLELSLRFAHQEDKDRVVNVARSVGWSPIDVDVDQMDWQDEDSHHSVHNITVGVDQVSFPLSSALLTGHSELDPDARCYIRYTFYDKVAVVSKCRKLSKSQSGTVLSTLNHRQNFVLSHTTPLQWYLREERLEIQAWITYGRYGSDEKKPRQRDKLVGCCYLDLESLTDLRRGQKRISGLFPLFKPGCSNLKAAFIRAHVTSRVSGDVRSFASENKEINHDLEISQSVSDTEHSESIQDWSGDFTIDKSPKKSKSGSCDPSHSFAVLLAVERAMHLPMVTERNRSGKVCPSTYVSYQSAERSKPTCSSVFPNSNNPVWDYAVETRLSTEYLFKENKHLVLKVWHKPSDASKSPDKSTDRVLGFVSIDLSPLHKGLPQICGWYNIIDFNGQCRGQIKVSITPQDQAGTGMSQNMPSTSFILPSFSLPARSLTTSDVTSSIAHQLKTLQQQVMHRMTSLTAAAAVGSSQDLNLSEDCVPLAKEDDLPITQNWQPQFTSETKTDATTKSYLESSLRRQLQELDSMTQRLKSRLTNPSAELNTSLQQTSSARSGEILTGTKSSLSTIHALSSLSNTRESSTHGTFDDVGASQESAHSHLLSNSSVLENAAERKSDDRGGGTGRRLLDSGIYSARNLSDKSGGEEIPDSHRSDKNATTSDNMSTLHSAYNENVAPHDTSVIGTLEGGFLAKAVGKTQTLLPVIDNSESSGNSHGFTPGTNRSNVTESFSVRANDRVTGGLKHPSGSNSNKSKASQSQSESTTARSEHSTEREKHDDTDDDEDKEENDELEERYGNYHHYRAMLDAEEYEDDHAETKSDEDMEVVEIIPKSLNNMSTVLALNSATEATPQRNSEKQQQFTDGLSSSPNINAHDGTSVWCSDDNDSFFQQVFEKNQGILMNADDAVEDCAIDEWFQGKSDQLDKTRLESWLEAHKREMEKAAENKSEKERELDLSNEEDMRLKLHEISLHDNEEEESARGDSRKDDHVWHVDDTGDSSDEETSRGMWVKKQSVDNFYDVESCPKPNVFDEVQQKEGTNQQKVSHLTVKTNEAAEISKLGASSNLLSVVEFTSTMDSSAQNKTLQSAISSSSAPVGSLLDSTLTPQLAPASETLYATFSEVSSLPMNQRTLDDYPFTLELADTHTETVSETSPSKLKHLLSNVELESSSSSPRPNSGNSKSSALSKLSLKTDSSKKSGSSNKSQDNSEKKCIHEQGVSHQLLNEYPMDGLTAVGNYSSHDSAYTENNSGNITASTVNVNGTHAVSEENTPEDSGTDQARVMFNGHVVNGQLDLLPNFFMQDEDLQVSIKALQLATSAASKINQEDIRAENKAKAVSELVNKMTNSKIKMVPLNVKNKQPPSAEEVKRIAKIFNSKIT